MKPMPEPPQPPVAVEPAAHALGQGVKLRVGAGPHAEILLSIDEARALSLALIAAVNRQERSHRPRPHGPRAT